MKKITLLISILFLFIGTISSQSITKKIGNIRFGYSILQKSIFVDSDDNIFSISYTNTNYKTIHVCDNMTLGTKKESLIFFKKIKEYYEKYSSEITMTESFGFDMNGIHVYFSKVIGGVAIFMHDNSDVTSSEFNASINEINKIIKMLEEN